MGSVTSYIDCPECSNHCLCYTDYSMREHEQWCTVCNYCKKITWQANSELKKEYNENSDLPI